MQDEELTRADGAVFPCPAPPVEEPRRRRLLIPEPAVVDRRRGPFAALTPFAAPPPDADAPGRLAVISCYFNPCGFEAPKRNYLRFADGLRRQRVPLYMIELAFNDAPFFLRPDEAIMRLRTTHVLWHKERLLNLLLERLPAQFDQVAWVDADVLFENADWAGEASRELDRVPVVQLFAEARRLEHDGRLYDTRTGVASAVSKRTPWARDLGRAHPGFAWAARRELLARHGLFDRNVAGAGDTIMVMAMYRWWDHPIVRCYHDAMLREFRRWGEPFYEDVRGQVGFVSGSILHLWHGSVANRRYIDRSEYLKVAAFDPRLDIAAGHDGTWEWVAEKPALHATIRNYFQGRREDG